MFFILGFQRFSLQTNKLEINILKNVLIQGVLEPNQQVFSKHK
jgi:hypothetical protein